MSGQKETEYVVTYSITGRATAILSAASYAEARRMARHREVTDAVILEWEFDEVEAIEVNR